MRINIKIAEKWNDLTPWQLRMIGRTLYKNESFEPKAFVLLLLVILTIQKPSIIAFLKTARLLLKVPVSDLKHYTDFVLDDSAFLTKFPVYLKSGRKKLYGPAPRLSNISISELSYADTFYYNWKTAGNDVDLERLVAVLYRLPIKSDKTHIDDIRVPFNKLLLPERAKLTDKISMAEKYIVGLAYEGSRQILINRYKNVFPKSPKSDDETSVKPKAKVYHPFSEIITTMVLDETQPFGSLPEAEIANAVSFLEIYDESIARQRERERKFKK